MQYPDFAHTFPLSTAYYTSTSYDFQGSSILRIEYDLTKNPIITTFGIRLGYQYFKTKTLKDRVGDD